MMSVVKLFDLKSLSDHAAYLVKLFLVEVDKLDVVDIKSDIGLLFFVKSQSGVSLAEDESEILEQSDKSIISDLCRLF
jgi:hypothetical protein